MKYRNHQVLLLIAALLLVTVLLSGCEEKQARTASLDPPFKKVSWGMSAEETIRQINTGGNTVYHQDGSAIVLWEQLKVDSCPAEVSAVFDERSGSGLYQMNIRFTKTEKDMIPRLEKLFGATALKDNTSDEAVWEGSDPSDPAVPITIRYSKGTLVMKRELPIHEKDASADTDAPSSMSEVLIRNYEAWDQMSSEEQILSSNLPGAASRYFESSREAAAWAEMEIVDPFEEALEKIPGMKAVNYTGTLFPDEKTALSQHVFVYFTGERSGKVTYTALTSGYDCGDIRITYTVETPDHIKGEVQGKTAAYDLPSGREAYRTVETFERGLAHVLYVQADSMHYNIRVLANEESPEMKDLFDQLASMLDAALAKAGE